MKALCFKLSGKTGFFKKPDVNVKTYFTYSNIHKVALLGILGAIIGLQGHIQQTRKLDNKSEGLDYPEFYDKLKALKVAIAPLGVKGYFTKKIQVFNNGVGYANKDGNLIVREQWLENPAWDIYLLDDGSVDEEIFDRLKNYIFDGKCVYIPYLGKNDHPANISDCRLIELEKANDPEQINSLFMSNTVTIGELPYSDNEPIYVFKEFMPIALSKTFNYYEFQEFCYTNLAIEEVSTNDIYTYNEKVLAFF